MPEYLACTANEPNALGVYKLPNKGDVEEIMDSFRRALCIPDGVPVAHRVISESMPLEKLADKLSGHDTDAIWLSVPGGVVFIHPVYNKDDKPLVH